jgi:hypothetical protein
MAKAVFPHGSTFLPEVCMWSLRKEPRLEASASFEPNRLEHVAQEKAYLRVLSAVQQDGGETREPQSLDTPKAKGADL